MSITVTNPEGRNVEFKDQRGPTCGLYALSFVLEYLYDIKIPATADGDKTRESLRNKFKKDGRTIIETLNGGGLCMVPFCVDASGKPDHSGIHAHWCVVQKNVAHASRKLADTCHWGAKFLFDLDVLRTSNNAIQDVLESWWGKDKDSTDLEYYSCDSEQSATAVDSLGEIHQLKPGSVKKIPATALSRKLAGKMLVFTR